MFTTGHFDKSETPGPPGFAILDDVDRRYFSELLESRTQIVVCGREREVPYIDIRHKTNPTNCHQ
jgi:hypothetical protein